MNFVISIYELQGLQRSRHDTLIYKYNVLNCPFMLTTIACDKNNTL